MPYNIKFTLSNKSILYDPDTDRFSSILDIADKAGLDIRRGCRSGHCGTCVVPLIKGEVEHIFGDKMTNHSPSSVLSCSFKPRTDLIIEA